VQPLDIIAHLRALARPSGAPETLSRALEELLLGVLRAAPSCLGVSLTLVRQGLPVTVTSLSLSAGLTEVRSSLAVQLPRRAAQDGPGPLLVLYSGAAGALDQLRLDLLALLDLDPRKVCIDTHLALPDLATEADVLAAQLDDLSALNQAVGVLLDRGLLPEQGRALLDDLAAAGDTSAVAAARLLLPTTPSDPEALTTRS